MYIYIYTYIYSYWGTLTAPIREKKGTNAGTVVCVCAWCNVDKRRMGCTKIAYSFLSDLKCKNVHVCIYIYICKHFPIILDRYMVRTCDVCFVNGHTHFAWNREDSNEIKKSGGKAGKGENVKKKHEKRNNRRRREGNTEHSGWHLKHAISK